MTSPIIGAVKPEMFGADITGNIDCSAAFMDAINSFPVGIAAAIELTPGAVYLLDSTATIERTVDIRANGALIIANVPDWFCFTINNQDNSETNKLTIDGIEFKWGGVFGVNTTGAIYIENSNNVSIKNCVTWGLGKEFVAIKNMICGEIESNVVREHLHSSHIISTSNDGADNIYLLRIQKNMLAFTSGQAVFDNIKVYSTDNLVIEDNALELGKNGLTLAEYGSINCGRITNNFCEANEVGIRLGRDNGDGYFGFLNSLQVRNNTLTGCDTGILAAGVLNGVEIKYNKFDVGTTVAIDVTSKQYTSLEIGSQNFAQDEGLRVVGNVYPQGQSCIMSTEKVIDKTDSLDGWSEMFDPSTNGEMSESGESLQMSFSATPTDQYIIQKTIPAVDLSKVETLVVPFYIDDPAKLRYSNSTDPLQVTRILGIGIDAASYWGWNLQEFSNGRTNLLKKGWNRLLFMKDAAHVVSGAPVDWSAVTYLQLRLQPEITTDMPVVKFGGVFGYSIDGVTDFIV